MNNLKKVEAALKAGLAIVAALAALKAVLDERNEADNTANQENNS